MQDKSEIFNQFNIKKARTVFCVCSSWPKYYLIFFNTHTSIKYVFYIKIQMLSNFETSLKVTYCFD